MAAIGPAQAQSPPHRVVPGTWLYAIPALEPVPEHPFGWTFGPPEPGCQLASDSVLRATGDVGQYLGRRYAKVSISDGTCKGEAGWIDLAPER